MGEQATENGWWGERVWGRGCKGKMVGERGRGDDRIVLRGKMVSASSRLLGRVREREERFGTHTHTHTLPFMICYRVLQKSFVFSSFFCDPTLRETLLQMSSFVHAIQVYSELLLAGHFSDDQ